MKNTLLQLLVPTIYVALSCVFSRLPNDPFTVTLIWLATYGAVRLVELIVDAIFWMIEASLASAADSFPHARREFTEPTQPTKFQDQTSDAKVYEYSWESGAGHFKLSRVVPLSEWSMEDGNEGVSQILSSTPMPAKIWPKAPEPPAESEFDEVERRLVAPDFQDRTNHGAPLDRAGKEF